ncbi:MAG: hypothetical protein M0017_02075 [Desulfobacteraceae bacterium]|nr:hypothetical protein [Desulfobacteraceae bacterium]
MTTLPGPDFPELSLAREAFLSRLFMRLGLLKPDFSLLHRVVAAFTAVTWLPLLIFALLDGTAVSGATVPFLPDFAVHIRFLLALPLLLIAEPPIERRLRQAAAHFVRSGLVPERNLADFSAAIRTTRALARSSLFESLFLVLAFAAILADRGADLPGLSDWRTAGHSRLALWWYLGVSLPLYRFLVFRWLGRLALWFWFLGRTAREDLQLNPTHPDHAGGLGFLGITHVPLGIIIFALASVVSGTLGKRIVYGEASLSSAAPLMAVFAVLAGLLVLAPLLVFSPLLLRARREGLFAYSLFADGYTDAFARKWITGGRREGEALGSSDIQSLADLANSFQIITRMRLVPFDRDTVLIVALAAVGPMIPLVLLAFPADKLFKIVIKILI